MSKTSAVLPVQVINTSTVLPVQVSNISAALLVQVNNISDVPPVQVSNTNAVLPTILFRPINFHLGQLLLKVACRLGVLAKQYPCNGTFAPTAYYVRE